MHETDPTQPPIFTNQPDADPAADSSGSAGQPPPPVPPRKPVADRIAMDAAVLGTAGVVIGSLLLGKRAGILAGLLGAGAKYLLEKNTAGRAAPSPPSAPAPPLLQQEPGTVPTPVTAELPTLTEPVLVERAEPEKLPKPEPAAELGAEAADLPATEAFELLKAQEALAESDVVVVASKLSDPVAGLSDAELTNLVKPASPAEEPAGLPIEEATALLENSETKEAVAAVNSDLPEPQQLEIPQDIASVDGEPVVEAVTKAVTQIDIAEAILGDRGSEVAPLHTAVAAMEGDECVLLTPQPEPTGALILEPEASPRNETKVVSPVEISSPVVAFVELAQEQEDPLLVAEDTVAVERTDTEESPILDLDQLLPPLPLQTPFSSPAHFSETELVEPQPDLILEQESARNRQPEAQESVPEISHKSDDGENAFVHSESETDEVALDSPTSILGVIDPALLRDVAGGLLADEPLEPDEPADMPNPFLLVPENVAHRTLTEIALEREFKGPLDLSGRDEPTVLASAPKLEPENPFIPAPASVIQALAAGGADFLITPPHLPNPAQLGMGIVEEHPLPTFPESPHGFDFLAPIGTQDPAPTNGEPEGIPADFLYENPFLTIKDTEPEAVKSTDSMAAFIALAASHSATEPVAEDESPVAETELATSAPIPALPPILEVAEFPLAAAEALPGVRTESEQGAIAPHDPSPEEIWQMAASENAFGETPLDGVPGTEQTAAAAQLENAPLPLNESEESSMLPPSSFETWIQGGGQARQKKPSKDYSTLFGIPQDAPTASDSAPAQKMFTDITNTDLPSPFKLRPAANSSPAKPLTSPEVESAGPNAPNFSPDEAKGVALFDSVGLAGAAPPVADLPALWPADEMLTPSRPSVDQLPPPASTLAIPLPKPASSAVKKPKRSLVPLFLFMLLLAGAGLGWIYQDALIAEWNAFFAPKKSTTKPVTPAPSPSTVTTQAPGAVPSSQNSIPVTGTPPADLKAPQLEPVTAAPAGPPVSSAEEQVSLEAAKTAVLELLKAESLEAILARILNPEKEASKIREHYGVRPIEALQLTSIRPESTGLMPDGKKRYIFVVETPAKAAAGAPPSTGTVKFFISAAETSDGFRVPWDLYIECRERRFSRFVSDAEYPPTSMRILIKRDHYFGSDIRTVDSMHCFKISSANPDDPMSHAFVPRNSTLAAELEKTVKWDQNYFLVAKLEHTSKDGDSFIEIREVNQWGWFEN